MKRTDQLAGALREQALVDFGMETGTYAGAAFSKGAVFNESGQGRPLPRVRYEAATATLKCTTYHGGGVDKKGDIGKAATAIENIGIVFSTDQLKACRQRDRLFEVTSVEDNRSVTISMESNHFRSIISTIWFCDLPSTSTQNESGIRKWLGFGESVAAILKFTVQKGDFARIAKLAETVA